MPTNDPNIFPALRYRDAPKAIEWLGTAFGFEPHFIVPGEEGTIAHAQLRLGRGMIMLGSARNDELPVEPPRPGGVVTQVIYVYVPDADAHYERAVAAGAHIERELSDTEYGSREYQARDPEGHLWSFGTYDPYA